MTKTFLPQQAAANCRRTNIALQLEKTSLALYEYARKPIPQNSGLILADTKFEFGILDNGELVLD